MLQSSVSIDLKQYVIWSEMAQKEERRRKEKLKVKVVIVIVS